MKKLIPYLFLSFVLLNAGFETDNCKDPQPVIRKYSFTFTKQEDYVWNQEKVYSKNFHDHTLTLSMQVQIPCGRKNLEIYKYTGDSLILRVFPDVWIEIRERDGKPDTVYKSSECFCNFCRDLEMTIDSLAYEPKVIKVNQYLVCDTVLKKYDKNGKLGEVKRK